MSDLEQRVVTSDGLVHRAPHWDGAYVYTLKCGATLQVSNPDRWTSYRPVSCLLCLARR